MVAFYYPNQNILYVIMLHFISRILDPLVTPLKCFDSILSSEIPQLPPANTQSVMTDGVLTSTA